MVKKNSDKYSNSQQESTTINEDLLTYDDYAALDDGNRYELVAGKLELMGPGPSVPHQIISYELQIKLTYTCREGYIILSSPIDLILSKLEVRQPDLLLIRRDRMHIIKKHGVVGPPDLVVEILSPSTRKRDKIGKLKTYAQYQIPEYWIIGTEADYLEQYILHGEQYELNEIYQGEEIVSSANIPCVSFTMKEIMDNIPDIQD